MSDECCARTREECEIECDEHVKNLTQQLESCQNELLGVTEQLKEAIDMVVDLANDLESEGLVAYNAIEFLAKYRGGGMDNLSTVKVIPDFDE